MQRRKLLAALIARGKIDPDRFLQDQQRPTFGIGFSGGGIRSATVSLGAIQALAKAHRLLDFDYMSSVSGGGYIASFLGSLFVPQSYRDSTSPPPRFTAIAGRTAYAFAVLTQAADKADIAAPEIPPAAAPPAPDDYNQIRSPLRWLRENGRYLAPNGATDYATAATYLSRNWLAMVYIFLIAMAAVFWLLHAGVAGLAYRLAAYGTPIGEIAGEIVIAWPHSMESLAISVLLMPVPIILVLSISAGVAYWATGTLQGQRRDGFGAIIDGHPRLAISAVALLQAIAAGAFAYCVRRFPPHGDSTADFTAQFDQVLTWSAITVTFLTAGFTLVAAVRGDGDTAAFFAVDARRLLTRLTTNLNLVLVLLLALGLIDTAGLWLHDRLLKEGLGFTHVAVAAVAPAAAWLISKLAGQSNGQSQLARLFANYLDEVTLLVGVLLFGGLAVLSDTLAHFLIWQREAWPAPDQPLSVVFNVPAMALGGAALIALALVTYVSTGFINLSSLHNYYATRLTRTYLGAANVERLRELDQPGTHGNIRDSQQHDDINIHHYQILRTPAPLHLINVTLNETGGSEDSPLVERDRKGLSLVFAPEGVVLNAGPRIERTWQEVEAARAEPLSLGQLCAISGAAVSPGMGSYTSLGLALCLTFANARLGYWWQSRALFEPVHRSWGGTYGYLLREMMARFRRDTDRVSLSDGGHFENSGAYELLQRKVDVVLVLDNGADPDYTFDELADLVRLARLDMALEITLAPPDVVAKVFGRAKAALFFNSLGDTWRAAAKTPDCKAFALLLKVTGGDATTNPRWIVWIKPRLGAIRAIDVNGYGLAHPTFPQESTADQFFNEAQWESYRAMGEDLLTSLLCPAGGADCLRRLSGWR